MSVNSSTSTSSNSVGGEPSERSALVNAENGGALYDSADPELARFTPPATEDAADSYGFGVGDLNKTIVLGGIDGIITSFAVVAAAAGAQLNTRAALVVGLGTMLANALKVGAEEFLSSQTHKEFVLSEKRREEWEFRNHKDVQFREMVQNYVEMGMKPEDAELVTRKFSENGDLFVDMKLLQEQGLAAPEEDDVSLIKESLVIILSFIIFGFVPLLGYLVFTIPLLSKELTDAELFVVVIIVTCMELFGLGAVKSQFSSRSWYTSGLESLLSGLSCGVLAYVAGYLLAVVFAPQS